MRILLVCPYAWDAHGGVQSHVRQLASTLRSRGHTVAVVAPARELDDEVRVAGRPVGLRWSGSVAPVCLSPIALRRLACAHDELVPDVVHVHEPFAPSVSMLATLQSRAPVVATFHSFDERSRVRRVARPLLRRLAARLARAIAVSHAAREALASEVSCPIEIIPNGVDPARFARPPAIDGPRGSGAPADLLWVHRLDPRKGFPIALEAFRLLLADRPDTSFVVVGDGPERQAVRRLAAAERARIEMLGAVSDADLPSHHARARVFVAAATGRESFGVALVEAMAAGLPVVATDIRGHREVVHDGVDGLLVPPRDATAMAGALQRVLDDRVLASRLARAGLRRAVELSWDRLTPQIERVYREAARAATAPRAINAE